MTQGKWNRMLARLILALFAIMPVAIVALILNLIVTRPPKLESSVWDCVGYVVLIVVCGLLFLLLEGLSRLFTWALANARKK